MQRFIRNIRVPVEETRNFSTRSSSSANISIPTHLIDVNSPGLACDKDHLKAIHNNLEADGILKLQLRFDDDHSHYLKDLLLNLCKSHHHGLPITHSAERGWFWDVRPSVKDFQSHNHQARSETMHRFDWHTDCSYEEKPPRYFALQVIQPDRYGGGRLSGLKVDQLLGLLSPFAQKWLSGAHYRINVPPEFIKTREKQAILGNLLALPTKGGIGSKLRFREDITLPMTTEAAQALEELKSILYSDEVQKRVQHFPAEALPRGSIIIMDNHRWLHARNEINDPDRHLRRVRWSPTLFALGSS